MVTITWLTQSGEAVITAAKTKIIRNAYFQYFCKSATLNIPISRST